MLVVDDNEDAAESLAMLLRLARHEVEVAYDGTTALKLAAELSPDVAVLDIGLPGMDGCEVVRRMRRLDWLAALSLVAVTGYGQDKGNEAAAPARFDLHVTKPVESLELAKFATVRGAPLTAQGSRNG